MVKQPLLLTDFLSQLLLTTSYLPHTWPCLTSKESDLSRSLQNLRVDSGALAQIAQAEYGYQ